MGHGNECDMLKGLKGEIDQRPKRFYRTVSVAGDAGAWTVLLDSKKLKTPEKVDLVLPGEAMARALAAEWEAQEERIDIASMFLTRTANVAIDRTPAARSEMVEEVAGYVSTDLLCYLADSPEELCARQDEAWTPLRDWAMAELGLQLETTDGLSPIEQPATTVAAVREHAAGLDDWRLTGLVFGVGLCGSAVLGLAIEQGRLSAVDAFELSRVDEAFQESVWGEEAEAIRVTERKRVEAAALDTWFGAINGQSA